ncbi:MAG: AMP-binding protein, partial [Nevskiaceae bacterium]
MSTAPLWSPSAERVSASNLTRFIECLRARRDLSLDDYPALHAWSVQHADSFWFELAHFTDIKADWADAPVLRHGDRLPGAEWFPGAQLNFAENLLRFRDEQPALIAYTEKGTRRAISYRQLHAEVGRVAAGLKAAGVGPGNRVAGFLPNIPEAVIAMLAATSLGAIWSSCSPDFGIAGVLDRFGQIAPTVLITVDGYHYGGKTHDSLGPMAAVLAQLPSVRAIIVVGYVAETPDLAPLQSGASERRVLHFASFGTAGAKLNFTRLP